MTRTISCGKYNPLTTWNARCGTKIQECYRNNPRTGLLEQQEAFATQTRVDGRWGAPTVWCPADEQPRPTLEAIREQAQRLLPHVAVGAAWSDTALVNAEVIFWADTDRHRPLPSVTIVGRRVDLRVDFATDHWDFGDGATDITTDPGKPYDSVGDPCRTEQCPSYYGHTFRHTGVRTVTLTIGWHAQYRIGAGAWTDLDDPITGPTSRHVITVKQARGVLIDNPH